MPSSNYGSRTQPNNGICKQQNVSVINALQTLIEQFGTESKERNVHHTQVIQ